MCSMPSCLSARPTWVRRGLSPAPPGLGGWGLVHRLAGLGGVEVVAAAVGVEGAEQALPRDGLLQPDETRGGPLLLDQDGREDRAGGVVHRDGQVECRPLRQPSVLRAVLEHQPGTPAWNTSMPGSGRRARFLRWAERFAAFVTKPRCCSTLLVH